MVENGSTGEKTPPFASNMGGIWQQQIWNARTILNSSLKTHEVCLTDESLHTLRVEVKAIVNSCLLTP